MKSELNGIELLRFLCAIAVILTHYHVFFQFGTWHEVAQTTYPLYAILFPAYNGGHWAVEFFWAISGFIFYWRYAESVQSGQTGARAFAVKRVSRLYPLHFVTLLAVALGQYVYFRNHGQAFIIPDNSAKAFGFQLFLASNWFTEVFSFNAPIWSVSVEIFTYAAFFLVVRQFGFNPIIALGVGLLSWALLRLSPHGLSPSVFECGLFFFFGGAAQRFYMRRGVLPLAAALTVGVAALLASGLIVMNVKWALVLAISTVVVFARLEHSVLDRAAFLGNATYSSYLIHFPLQLVIVIFMDAVGIDREWLMSTPALLAFLALVVGCSLVVYHRFERPMQDRIRLLGVKGIAFPLV